jgi:NADPH:quinone reductase-like Zn-dependent oxidoreductase
MADRVREAAPNVDRVLDVAGNGVLPELISLVGGRADRVVTVADGDAGRYGVTFTAGRSRRYWEALDLAASLWKKEQFVLPIAQTFSLEDGAAAHRASELGHVLGKIVIRVRP